MTIGTDIPAERLENLPGIIEDLLVAGPVQEITLTGPEARWAMRRLGLPERATRILIELEPPDV